jgi:hypothetical protein
MQKVFKAKLSTTKKKIEAQKLTEENRRILHRIQEVPPVYNHIEWEVNSYLFIHPFISFSLI